MPAALKSVLTLCASVTLSGILSVLLNVYKPLSKYPLMNTLFKVGVFVIGWAGSNLLMKKLEPEIYSEVDRFTRLFTQLKTTIDQK